MQGTRGTTLSPSEAGRPRRTVLLFAALAVIVLGADQATKALALAHLTPGVPRNVIGTLVRFNLITNPGAAFSLASGFTIVLTLVACTIVVVVIRLSARLASKGWAAALGSLLGGALGNVVDRLFREPGPLRGHVVDFVQLPHWAIFNVADMGVTFGAIGIAILAIRGINLDGSTESRVRDGEADEPDAERDDDDS